MALPQPRALGLLAAFAVTAVLGGLAWKGLPQRTPLRSSSPARRTYGVGDSNLLRVPHIAAAITLDGDTDDPGWTQAPGPVTTKQWVNEAGGLVNPYSEARMLWGDGHLYLLLYAADEEIVSTAQPDQPPSPADDSFHVVFSRAGVDYLVEVSPRVVADAIRRTGGQYDYSWNSGVHVSHEMDGTLNDPSNLDEEWVIEMAMPLESLGLKGEPGETLDLSMRRCDKPKGSPRICSGWEGHLVLD